MTQGTISMAESDVMTTTRKPPVPGIVAKKTLQCAFMCEEARAEQSKGVKAPQGPKSLSLGREQLAGVLGMSKGVGEMENKCPLGLLQTGQLELEQVLGLEKSRLLPLSIQIIILLLLLEPWHPPHILFCNKQPLVLNYSGKFFLFLLPLCK